MTSNHNCECSNGDGTGIAGNVSGIAVRWAIRSTKLDLNTKI